MRRIRIAGLCLVAVFAMSIIASSTASAAAPEFGQCLKNVPVGKVFSGEFSDSKCTKKVAPAEVAKKGKFEWLPGAVAGKNGFTTKGGAATLATKGGKTVTCTSEKSSGEYTVGGDNKHESTTVEFAGCKSSNLNCTTEGKPNPGELETNALVGEVGFENVAKKKTALKLEPAPSAKGKFITFECIGLVIAVRGKGEAAGAGILVNIKNDKMTATETLKYKASKGVQKPVKWEGPNPETYLESSFEKLPFEQSGQTVTSVVTNNGGQKYELNLIV